MSCEATQSLIHGYLDGELDLVRSMEIERHLNDCESCARAYQNQQSLRSLIRGGSLYFKAPAGLESRIHARLREVHRTAAKPQPAAAAEAPSRPSQAWWSPSWTWAGMAAALALAAVVISILRPGASRPSQQDLLVEEVVSSHIRSLMLNHLTDVTSSDQHNVKPWFNGKLDFSPSVVNLAPEGFPLVGGRLDYLDGRPVAALVYGRRQHLINVFVWPSPSGSGSGAPTQTAARQGYNVVDWTQSGMTWWAVSDLNAQELQEFVAFLKQH